MTCIKSKLEISMYITICYTTSLIFTFTYSGCNFCYVFVTSVHNILERYKYRFFLRKTLFPSNKIYAANHSPDFTTSSILFSYLFAFVFSWNEQLQIVVAYRLSFQSEKTYDQCMTVHTLVRWTAFPSSTSNTLLKYILTWFSHTHSIYERDFIFYNILSRNGLVIRFQLGLLKLVTINVVL